MKLIDIFEKIQGSEVACSLKSLKNPYIQSVFQLPEDTIVFCRQDGKDKIKIEYWDKNETYFYITINSKGELTYKNRLNN